MNTDFEYSFIRYLISKKSVDDRALNRHVWDTLNASLSNSSSGNPLQILEIGAGIGTMIVRILEQGLVDHAEYEAIDIEEQNIAHALLNLPIWGQEKGFNFEQAQAGGRLSGENVQLDFHLEAVDLHDFIASHTGKRTWDLIIAHAFLDLVEVPRIIPGILNLGADDCLYYFSLNYDGLTVLEPEIQPEYDQRILAAYNQTMDQRRVAGRLSGDSQSGRHLFGYLVDADVQIIAAGSSDWVVYPQPGGYPHDEAYFLHYLIHTIFQALRDQSDIDQERFRAWIAERHAQVDRGELVCIAHQIDILAQNPGGRHSIVG